MGKDDVCIEGALRDDARYTIRREPQTSTHQEKTTSRADIIKN